MRSRCQRRVSLGRRVDVPEKIPEYTPWFTNVEGGWLFGALLVQGIPVTLILEITTVCNLLDRHGE